ncbi:MAG: hypothetical protein KJN63_03305 [Acidimicrobiia bacterium]|nr:hypothetical protein [Acidimicrobiia bacterium]
MNALRARSTSDVATTLLANFDVRATIDAALTAAGEFTAQTLSSIADGEPWYHRLDFRCEPAGRQVDGVEAAGVMDTHDELAGTLMVGCLRDVLQPISGRLTSHTSAEALDVSVRALEAGNIIGSAYLNGLRSALDHVEYSSRAFLPSPPRFLRSSIEMFLEVAIGGQALGDRGWIADHRLRSGSIEIVMVWIPTAEAIVAVGTADRAEA